jgi:hypothetical protein
MNVTGGMQVLESPQTPQENGESFQFFETFAKLAAEDGLQRAMLHQLSHQTHQTPADEGRVVADDVLVFERSHSFDVILR